MIHNQSDSLKYYYKYHRQILCKKNNKNRKTQKKTRKIKQTTNKRQSIKQRKANKTQTIIIRIMIIM